MSAHFKVWADADGNLYMEEGLLIAQHATTEWFTTGGTGTVIPMQGADGFQAAAMAGAGFTGGSGRNVTAAGTVPGTLVPLGQFVPASEDTWVALGGEAVELIFDPGDGSATIEDGTGVIATLPAASATVAPYGTFTATNPYGRSFNGGAAWTVDLEFEGGDPWGARQAVAIFSGSTVPGGFYSPTGWQAWESDVTPGWVITLDGTGAGELSGGTDVVAARAADAARLRDPSGDWVSTVYAATNYGHALATVAGAVTAGTFPDQAYRLADTTGTVETWVGVDDGTKYIVFDTADGDADLYDETGLVGSRLTGVTTANFYGTYTANTDGEDRYNGGSAWDYTVATTSAGQAFTGELSLARAVPIDGVLYVTIARDAGTDEATGMTGPFRASAMPANTSTEVHWPVAEVAAGVVKQLQYGPIRWMPNP